MDWQCHPDYLTCIPRHGFDAGVIDRLILTGNGERLSLITMHVNEVLVVAEPVGFRLPAGSYSLEAASVNGVRPLGTIRLDRTLTRLALVVPNQLGKAFSVVIGVNAILRDGSGVEREDALFDNLAGVNSALHDTLHSLLFAPEDLLRVIAAEGILDLAFLTCIPVNRPKVALVEEAAPNIARPLQAAISNYFSGLRINCDVCLFVHGSLNHTRASAIFTQDDLTGAKDSFKYDGRRYNFGHKTKVPGVATLSYYSFDLSHTPLHELGHAASERDNGQLIDLYHDRTSASGLVINKKRGRPIPMWFARYNSNEFAADHSRDHVGYDSGWASFHPEPVAHDLPNLMDDYWLAQTDPINCRFDQLTRAWLLDRFRAKAKG